MHIGYPIVGVIRFSFFGPTDTVQKHNYAEALSELYDPARLEARFRVFETLTLPSLRAQTDPNFTILVVTSEVMPEPWQSRLKELVDDLPQGRLHIAKTKDLTNEILPVLREICEQSPNLRAATFRLDDDDALSRHYIQRVRELSVNLPEKTIVTFPHNLSVYRDTDDTLGLVRRRVFCIGAGLVRIISTTFLRHPFAMQHGIVWKRFLTISDPTFLSNIVTYHAHNDTVGRRKRHLRIFKESVPEHYLTNPAYWQNIVNDLEVHFPKTSIEHLAQLVHSSLKPIQREAIGQKDQPT